MRAVNKAEREDVEVINSTSIQIDGDTYEIVSPTETIYPDHEYVEYNGAVWVRL